MKLSHHPVRSALLGLFFTAGAVLAEPGFDPLAFSPDPWPGKAPAEIQRALRPLSVEFTQALRARDVAALTSTREKLIAALGVYAGVPEERPVYGQPADPAKPDTAKVGQLWRSFLKSQAGRRRTRLSGERAGGKWCFRLSLRT